MRLSADILKWEKHNEYDDRKEQNRTAYDF